EEDAVVRAEHLFEVAPQVVGRLALGEEGHEWAAPFEQVGEYEGGQGTDRASQAERPAGFEGGGCVADAGGEGEGGEASAEVGARHGQARKKGAQPSPRPF